MAKENWYREHSPRGKHRREERYVVGEFGVGPTLSYLFVFLVVVWIMLFR